MRALAIDYEAREVCERDVPPPAIARPDEALVRILEAGVCGTDRYLAAFRSGAPPPGDRFLVLGHEAVGEVAQAGPASGLEPGDLVVPTVRRPCEPPCSSCRRGRRDLCTTGRYTERGIFRAHGYFTQLAVDRGEDLIRIPADCAESAILIEPLSVVEKAVETAVRLHVGEPAVALVFGAGTIGLLAAVVLRLRGFDLDLVSLEPAGSTRARLAEDAGARYLAAPDRRADIVIEAAGSSSAVAAGLEALQPLGVLIVLGAAELKGPAPLMPLILGNQIVAGSVNASPDSFRRAAEDLKRLPRALVGQFIERRSFGEYRESLFGNPPSAPKVAHVMG